MHDVKNAIRNKKLLGTKGIATRSKDATSIEQLNCSTHRGQWHGCRHVICQVGVQKWIHAKKRRAGGDEEGAALSRPCSVRSDALVTRSVLCS